MVFGNHLIKVVDKTIFFSSLNILADQAIRARAAPDQTDSSLQKSQSPHTVSPTSWMTLSVQYPVLIMQIGMVSES